MSAEWESSYCNCKVRGCLISCHGCLFSSHISLDPTRMDCENRLIRLDVLLCSKANISSEESLRCIIYKRTENKIFSCISTVVDVVVSKLKQCLLCESRIRENLPCRCWLKIVFAKHAAHLKNSSIFSQ